MTVDGENAKLTLKGGNAQNRGNVAVARNGGEIVVESGEYTSTNSDVFRAQPLGSVTVNGGTLTGSEGAVICYGKGSKDGTPGCFGTIVINGGNLIGLDNFAVATNGTAGMGHNSITINGGHLEGNIKSAGYEAIGVYLPNNDTFVMNGGEIIANGGTGICQRGGNATINGGSITATNVDKNGNIVADGWIGDKKTVMTGCSAVIYHCLSGYSGYTEGMRLSVTNGTITGVDHAIQIVSDEEEPKVFVSGGTFTPAYPEPVSNEPADESNDNP